MQLKYFMNFIRNGKLLKLMGKNEFLNSRKFNQKKIIQKSEKKIESWPPFWNLENVKL